MRMEVDLVVVLEEVQGARLQVAVLWCRPVLGPCCVRRAALRQMRIRLLLARDGAAPIWDVQVTAEAQLMVR